MIDDLSLLRFALELAQKEDVLLVLSCQALARFLLADLEYYSRCYGAGEW